MYLHGDLQLHIIQASNLPNMDLTSFRLRRWFACDVCRKNDSGGGDGAVSNRNKKIHHRGVIIGDAYVTVLALQTTLARTRVIPNSPNPMWDEHFYIPLAHRVAYLEFRVKDTDVFGAQIMGSVQIPAKDIAAGGTIPKWYDVFDPSGKPPKPGAALRLQMKPVGDPQFLGVRRTYFPLRKGCSVKLYQDAHVKDSNTKLPEVKLEGGITYERGTCWEDICHAISEAHHLVYIVGWSVRHSTKLIRETRRALPPGGNLTLGELLKYKSEEGVRVLLLVWDDRFSKDALLPGVMGTHDEETKKFFKHSSVICILSPRRASTKLSFIKQFWLSSSEFCFWIVSVLRNVFVISAFGYWFQTVGNMFTHHQKCVLVDTQGENGNRRITAFLGGLDLCDGRYDTPEHRLFHDLDTVFKGDFHQPSLPAGTKAPRQPWHDLHCRIDGPAAYDVLINFAQRWRRATRWREFAFGKKRRSKWHDDAMIKVERISWILSPAFSIGKETTSIPRDDPELYVNEADSSKNWHVQIFRSIDSGSVKGFPKLIDTVEKQNLICGKNLVVDKSIQTAYIQAIRSAKNFIYIENQYFLGSSYGWPSYKDAGADHLIPMELALKIASKIRAKERFAVYVVVPMWPEGDPKSAPMQEILFWQSQTMQMMFEIISQEIKDVLVHPSHYLNFYCLGQREDVPSSLSQSDADKIYGYRMSLWEEHLGKVEECFKKPETLECVTRVNEIARDNWEKYTSESFTAPLQGHLLRYPLDVNRDGRVSSLSGFENFPDVGGKIMGAYSPVILDLLTT
nr:phospholipase D delta-like [Ipomoea batatas]